jgi:hypothetical protein
VTGSDEVLGRFSRAVEIKPFSARAVEQSLRLKPPPLTRVPDALKQLRNIEQHVAALGCQSFVIERRYTDRDYIEDHSAFYSRNLFSYQNFCDRVHFFAKPVDQVREHLNGLVEEAGNGQDAFKVYNAAFSDSAYLGFAVIKPLTGCPVGRTVLRPFPAQDRHVRFTCVRRNMIHLGGAELIVSGVPFQQQDLAVSACATTALWSALDRLQHFESVSPATPAQITSLASRFTLPFGRSMPSEGLSIDQMCQAIQALGAAPNLIRAEKFIPARQCLYSSLISGFSPILLVNQDERRWHAITATGLKVRPRQPNDIGSGIDDPSGDLEVVYVHDDRHGPYLEATVSQREGKFWLSIKSSAATDAEREDWELGYILIPLHPKIRLAFSGLSQVASRIVARLHAHRQKAASDRGKDQAAPLILTETRIVKAHQYINERLFDTPRILSTQLKKLAENLGLSRYVGVIRLSGPEIDRLDILVDTTGPWPNAHCLAMVPNVDSKGAVLVARLLGTIFECEVVV